MAAVNARRVWLGALLGWVVWMAWSGVVNLVVLMPRYVAAQEAGAMLKQPRYSFFMVAWWVLLFVLSAIYAWIYAGVRATRGAGPKTALSVGVLAGFASGFPLAFSLASWSPLPRIVPFWWMLDLWVGAILATLVAGWLYRD
jgi:hypothetical protein